MVQTSSAPSLACFPDDTTIYSTPVLTTGVSSEAYDSGAFLEAQLLESYDYVTNMS